MSPEQRRQETPSERNEQPRDPRSEYIAARLRTTRLRTLQKTLGVQEGMNRLEIQTEVLTEVVAYLDTPRSRRPEQDAFYTGLVERAQDKGWTISQRTLEKQGQTLFEKWLERKHALQRGSNPYSGTGGVDANVYIGDHSHRKSYGNE